MDSVPTTFIPKQTLISRPETGSAVGGIFMFIGLVALLASGLLFGGALLFEKQLTNEIASSEVSLKKAQGALDTQTLQELERLDSRLISANELLDSHISLLPLFDFFSANTLQTVRWRAFNYSFNPQTKKIDIRASGEAKGFESVALQSDKFVTTGDVKDFMFSDTNLDAMGRVQFNFSASIDPRLVSFREAITDNEQTEAGVPQQ